MKNLDKEKGIRYNENTSILVTNEREGDFDEKKNDCNGIMSGSWSAGSN